MFNIMHSFKGRIFALVVSLIIIVLALSMRIFYLEIADVENVRFQNDLTNARETVQIYLTERKEQFRNTQEALNKAIVTSRMFLVAESAEDMNEFLKSLMRRTRAHLMMTINLDGEVVGQMLRQPAKSDMQRSTLRDGPESGQMFRGDLNVAELSDGKDLIYELEGKYYQFTLSQARAATEAVGWVAYGYLLDEQLARVLKRDYVKQHDVNFNLRDSTLPGECRLIATSKTDIQILIDGGQSISCDTSTDDFQSAQDPIVIGEIDNYVFEAVVYGSIMDR